MNAQELLIRLTDREIDSLFRAARALPEDRLAWQPAPGARSALDQLQEVATGVDIFWSAYNERKLEWNLGSHQAWVQERSQITTLDELEHRTRESHARLYDLIRATDPSEFTAPVQLPFPGEYTLADVLAYAFWNAAYHEGQITYIASLLEGKSQANGAG